VAQARSLGIRSTPTFFINGRPVVGAQPIETFRAAIDDALGAAR
jgi:protein-disulfide isomerase